MIEGAAHAQQSLSDILKAVSMLNPSPDAIAYWRAVNNILLSASSAMLERWQMEKQAANEAMKIAKDEALTFLSEQRERIMRMSHEQAIAELLSVTKLDSRMQTVQGTSDNRLLDIR